jgi:hypothetical protein
MCKKDIEDNYFEVFAPAISKTPLYVCKECIIKGLLGINTDYKKEV